MLKAGDKESFTKLNLPLVSSIAKRFLNRGYEYDDIFQIGCLGLVKAINRFDFNYEVKFSTYAYPMVEGEIRRFVRDDMMIRVPRNLNVLATHIHFAKDKLSKDLNREPTTKELAEYLNVTEQDIKNACKMYADTNTDSLDRNTTSVHNESKNITLGEMLPDDFNLEEETIKNVDLKNALEKLPPKQKEIMYLRSQDYTQVQTAKILNMSQVQVSRLEKKALIKLKNYLGSDKLSKKEDAINLFKQGFTAKEVMDKLHITKSTANTYKSYYNRENNVPNRKMEAFKMLSQCFKSPAIESKLGLTKSTVATYKHEFTVIKGRVFTRLTEGKSEESIVKELKIDKSLVHNLKREWVSQPIKPENIISSNNTNVKIKPVEHIKKQVPEKESIKDTSIKLTKEIQPKNIEENKINEEEKHMSLKPLVVGGTFGKYDLTTAGVVKIDWNSSIERQELKVSDIDALISELKEVKATI